MESFTKHTPFLLTACNHNGKGNKGFTLYSIPDKLHFEFDEPFLHEKIFIGSQYGWLAVLDQHGEPTLLNPLTGELISLPSITTLIRVRPHYSVNGNIASYFYRTTYRQESPFLDRAFDDYLTEVPFKKILLSSNPSTSSSNFFVAALLGGISRLIISRSGESRWNLLRERQWYMDIMFRQNGKLICLTNKGAIHEVNLKDDEFVITEMSAPFVTENCQFNMYLAEDCAGRVLVIIRRYDITTVTGITETVNVEVFRLEESKWERIKSLDGQAIFVGTNASLSLAKHDVRGGIKADTIYFTDEWWDQMGGDAISLPRDICAYNMMSNAIKPCCPYKHRQCTWPLPVWVHLSNSI